MAKKFGRLLMVTAALGAVAGGVYYYLKGRDTLMDDDSTMMRISIISMTISTRARQIGITWILTLERQRRAVPKMN